MWAQDSRSGHPKVLPEAARVERTLPEVGLEASYVPAAQAEKTHSGAFPGDHGSHELRM